MMYGTILRDISSLLTVITCFAAAILAAKEKIYYADFEHVEITYFNPKYMEYLNVTARRYSRRDPTHYVNIYVKSLMPLGKNVTVEWYIYQFLSNEYRRSFVEAHHNLCDFILKDDFGKYLKEKLNDALQTCPFPKAVYQLENMSIPNLPLLATFPFHKGRMYINWTLTHPKGVKEWVAGGHIDAVIKIKFQ